MSSEYVTLKIPVDLADTIDNIIELRRDMGYKSRAEFVKEAIRKHISDIRAEKIELIDLSDIDELVERRKKRLEKKALNK